MNRKINRLFILALVISAAFAACNGGGTKEAANTTADSTGTAKTDTVQQAPQDTTPDAVKAAPNLYKVISDSMGIRVLEATYKPGDSSAMHSHPDYALYVIEGGTAEFTGKDGKKMINEMKTGAENIRSAEVHRVKNTGKKTIKVLLVEVNRPMGTVSNDAAMDATKVAPDEYKLKRDTLGIRILEATYKPGQSSAMHTHPDNAVYVINGGASAFTEKDGTKQTHELKTGMSMIAPAGTHSVKNIGKTTTKVLIVEVNRPAK
ncbi:MAG: cupin domain-containing protein [Bacteroidota bacterium]|nr:cupin domain-containing protein [Bacteroidota bacterium]